jgi:hypothetical protein
VGEDRPGRRRPVGGLTPTTSTTRTPGPASGHAVQFGFEHDVDNVITQSRELRVDYPVAVAADGGRCGRPRPTSATPRSTGFASEDRARFDRAHRYTAVPELPHGLWDLSGTRTVAPHAALLVEPGGRLSIEFHARDLNLVVGPRPGGGPVPFRILLDGEAVGGTAGTDVAGRRPRVRHRRALLPAGPPARGDSGPQVRDRVPRRGVEAYCVAFG